MFLVFVKRYYTNLKNILKLKEINVCRTVHWKMLTVQVWHSLSKLNHMFKVQFFHTLVLYSSKHVSHYIWLICYKGIANLPYNDNSILIADKQFTGLYPGNRLLYYKYFGTNVNVDETECCTEEWHFYLRICWKS